MIAVGKLKQIEDLPLFIEGIDKDITSDITTRIIFEALADFTAHMIDTYPHFKSGGHRIGTVKCQAWDVVASDWMDKSFETARSRWQAAASCAEQLGASIAVDVCDPVLRDEGARPTHSSSGRFG
ncbi:hypothetical protein GS421_08960 [Rhodococcus hoagii]|nr:hypothetical protein [Prescottella equi]